MLYILNILVIGSLRHQRILFFCIEQKNYPIKSLCPCVANIIISLFFKNLFGGGGGGWWRESNSTTVFVRNNARYILV